MAYSVVPFAPEHLPSLQSFSEDYFDRPRTDAYYQWRYLESIPFSKMFLALDGAKCLGLVSAFRKRYLIGGQDVPCLEVFDWHCLPGMKGSGVGIRVMRAMMREPERVFSFGGTADVLSTLPAMGWQRIGAARIYELPSSGDFLAAGLQRRTGLPARATRSLLGAVSRAWFRPHRSRPPKGGRVVPVSVLGDEVLELYRSKTGYGIVQQPDPSLLSWLACGYPGTGRFDFLSFTVDGRSRGWSLSRVYETGSGTEAALLDLYCPEPDVALYTWMVSETTTRLLAFRPWMVRARASCPTLRAALRANRYREGADDIPVHTWPAGLSGDTNPIHVTLNHADEPLRPYPVAGTAARFLSS